ncbi:hypothetical protein Pmani_005410 [Petrolisthes manimaculis]|uniref:Chitin-binding type-2 domain-containing protein n=1 Tax=Petrolisthes manimaculis TaxID=1843537 RepID=A0AAE1QCS4_9EUCA|nr:hypothetical protein Pmani_005410 [Petrolisthes manimaculis]
MKKRVMSTVQWSVVVAGGVPRDACKPADCGGALAGDPIGSLCDCSKYYICLTDNVISDTPITCPPEAPYFDPNIPGFCGNDPSNCPTSATGSCPVMCADLGSGTPPAPIIDPTDCTKYYICQNETSDPIGPVTCQPDTPWFNGAECVSDQAGCCAGSSALCEPYCTVDDQYKQIIDPLNCTNYYICMAEGPPSELYHLSCPSGETFDMTDGSCSAEAPCITLCNSTDGGGMTTGSGDCQDTMTCTVDGSFPKCTTCQKQYFYCPSNQGEAYVMECSGELVFNTDASYPYCVLPTDCPHIA